LLLSVVVVVVVVVVDVDLRFGRSGIGGDVRV
jgi:hypothetical protein